MPSTSTASPPGLPRLGVPEIRPLVNSKKKQDRMSRPTEDQRLHICWHTTCQNLLHLNSTLVICCEI